MRHATILAAALVCCAGIAVHADDARAADATSQLTGSAQDLMHECSSGEAIKLTGSDNQVVLHGDCASLRVVGAGNSVHADMLKSVDVRGSDNQVYWKTGNAPAFNQIGTGNALLQEGKEGP